MGVLRESGSTKLSLPVAAPGGPKDEMLEAVRDTARGEFEVLGEIGRSPDGTVAYLARDLSGKKLVALRLSRGPGNEYLLEVANRLDNTVPAPRANCPNCRAPVRGWERFCTQCGVNLWGSAGDERGGAERWNKQELLAAVQQATRGKFEIIGDMGRKDRGGVVYFARDLETGRIEALRLQQEGDDFSVGLTGVLQRFAGSISALNPRGGGGR